jgi:hypothetical protein
LFGVAAAALPAARLATGTAIVNMARQIGMAIGVAMVVAVIGPGAPTLAALHDDFVAMALVAAACAVAALVLMRPRATAVAPGAEAAAPARAA